MIGPVAGSLTPESLEIWKIRGQTGLELWEAEMARQRFVRLETEIDRLEKRAAKAQTFC
jgi:hypothetical protein